MKEGGKEGRKEGRKVRDRKEEKEERRQGRGKGIRGNNDKIKLGRAGAKKTLQEPLSLSLSVSFLSLSLCTHLQAIVRMEWLLLECSFMSWEPTALLF